MKKLALHARVHHMKKTSKKRMYEVYDKIINWFDASRSKDLAMEKFYLNLIKKYSSPGDTVLDVGCGTGEPIAKFFIEAGYKLTGIDASIKMIELCKQRFPKGEWILADMRNLQLQMQFDVVIAWHSLFHLPYKDQKNTLRLLISYVKKQGLFIFTTGTEHAEEWVENGGCSLYHASLSSEEYEKILIKNNCKVLIHKIRDPNCGGATIWVAKKN